eukprot:TRINITY_DN50822_c0_g1_i1.p1 TRINITY_DN50822_c0_g1~~TRINITY_DN50822_c0_g1_i1.p1  ORF type:complete len:387 (+),score=112.52 TRINITY_DN50822_c0_g1_i1:57-1217(+)
MAAAVIAVSLGVLGLACAARFAVSPLRRLPPVHGRYKRLGSQRLRAGAFGDGPQIQCVYPTLDSEGMQGEYTTPVSAAGLGVAMRSKVMEWLSWFLLSWQPHPNIIGAAILPRAETPGRKGLPLVLFSHGLFGTCDMYLQLARDIASYGVIVVSISHNDGTSSHDPHNVPYRHPPAGMQYSNKDEVVQFRKPFLDRREKEVDEVLRYLKKDEMLKSYIDFSKIILAGHSFGAAAVMDYGQRKIHDKSILGYLLYDTWTYALGENVKVSRPALAVQSSLFANNNEAPERNERLGQDDHLHSFWIPQTSHQLWSDFAFLLPSFVNPVTHFRDPHEHHKSWVEATHMFLHHYLAPGEDTADEARKLAALVIPPTPHRKPVSKTDVMGQH